MFLLLIFLFSSSLAFQPSCTNLGQSRIIGLSVNSTKSQDGKWIDGISAWVVVRNSLNPTQMDIAHTITHCDEGRILHIQGVTPVLTFAGTNDRLKFHSRCGKNVAILDNGLTVQRIKMEVPDNSAVFTNRPLKDREIFEIKIEEKNSKFTWGAGIGIVTISPKNLEILPKIFKSPYVWMHYGTNLLNNGAVVVKNIGVNNQKLQVGDTIGVMRSEMGTLHFFVNGEDQGPAMANVPPNVYGVLDLRENDHKASIV